jgi:hypothetical protein
MKKSQLNNADSAPLEIVPVTNMTAPTTEIKFSTITELNQFLHQSRLTDTCSKRDVAMWAGGLVGRYQDQAFSILESIRANRERDPIEKVGEFLLRRHIIRCLDLVSRDFSNKQVNK